MRVHVVEGGTRCVTSEIVLSGLPPDSTLYVYGDGVTDVYGDGDGVTDGRMYDGDGRMYDGHSPPPLLSELPSYVMSSHMPSHDSFHDTSFGKWPADRMTVASTQSSAASEQGGGGGGGGERRTLVRVVSPTTVKPSKLNATSIRSPPRSASILAEESTLAGTAMVAVIITLLLVASSMRRPAPTAVVVGITSSVTSDASTPATVANSSCKLHLKSAMSSSIGRMASSVITTDSVEGGGDGGGRGGGDGGSDGGGGVGGSGADGDGGEFGARRRRETIATESPIALIWKAFLSVTVSAFVCGIAHGTHEDFSLRCLEVRRRRSCLVRVVE